jgi:hypothetical protein
MARFPANGGPYEVIHSGAVTQALRRLFRQATREGRAEAFLSALRQIMHRLERSPNRFGEPLYRLPALRLQIRSAIIRPLGVHFGVHEGRLLVFIHGFRLMAQ